ncbi:MAG: ABC transporter ATP-binding protein [Exiguobacterium sp.]
MLEVKGLQKRYGRKKQVLRDVTFSVGLNEVTCLIGLNGEGKSTILKAILGLIPVDAGTVTVAGPAMWRSNRREVGRASRLISTQSAPVKHRATKLRSCLIFRRCRAT